MKVLVTAKNGQLGYELKRVYQKACEIQEEWTRKTTVVFIGSDNLDIRDSLAVQGFLLELKPDLVINAAAYTEVDQAEFDPDTAYAVNKSGVENLALACKFIGAKCIHISTDFVFSSTQNIPYKPDDVPAPLNTYGKSKLAGELVSREILGDDICIVRTAWVYSIHGNNFVKTMIRLMREQEHLNVVVDQVGTPTSAYIMAQALWRLSMMILSERTVSTTYHWTDLGVSSWFDFSVAIQELAFKAGLLQKMIPIHPVPSSQYHTTATRPAYTVLDTSSLRRDLSMPGIHWQKALNSMIQELAKQQ